MECEYYCREEEVYLQTTIAAYHVSIVVLEITGIGIIYHQLNSSTNEIEL